MGVTMSTVRTRVSKKKGRVCERDDTSMRFFCQRIVKRQGVSSRPSAIMATHSFHSPPHLRGLVTYISTAPGEREKYYFPNHPRCLSILIIPKSCLESESSCLVLRRVIGTTLDRQTTLWPLSRSPPLPPRQTPSCLPRQQQQRLFLPPPPTT